MQLAMIALGKMGGRTDATLSIHLRLRSRRNDAFGATVLAALRNEFGGHAVKES